MPRKKKISLVDAVDRREYPLTHKGLLYCSDILAGKAPACNAVGLACERVLKDFSNPHFRYQFDPDRSEDFLEFGQKLPHVKGRWASRKENKIRWEPWQCLGLGQIFGWIDEKGRRRFRVVYWSTPRKSGKSVVGAVIGNYMFVADYEHGAEVYSGAATEKQAWEVFRPAMQMVKRTPRLRQAFDIVARAKSMHVETDGSRFEPVIGNPGDGAMPHCAIVDEYHEQKTSNQLDTMLTGMVSREQPLLLIITTAGTDTGSPCYEKYEEAKAILSGAVVDDRQFVYIFEAEPTDDIADPEALRRANPNLGVSMDEDSLLEDQKNAALHTAKQNPFRVKHLNQWTDAKVAYFNTHSWKKLAVSGMKIEDYRGWDCSIGLDMALKSDFAAKINVFYDYLDDGRIKYIIFPTLYLPEDRIAEDQTGRYRRWKEQGYIQVTEGNEIDFQRVQDDIVADMSLYDLHAVMYDPAYTTQLAQGCRAEGVPMIEFNQGPLKMGPPMDELYTAIESGRVVHDGNLCFQWMLGNVINYREKAKLPAPAKQSKAQKIDGPVAAMMAIVPFMAGVDYNAAIEQFVMEPIRA